MELRHLRCLAVLAEELHFSRAAERLGIAQPALTQQIQALEREFGVRLFQRTKRSVHLTVAGKLTLEEALRLDVFQQQINHDPITGLATREYFMSQFGAFLQPDEAGPDSKGQDTSPAEATDLLLLSSAARPMQGP